MTIRPTEASERCRLRGSYTLRTGVSALELWGGAEPGTQLYDWPYRFLRRFGRDKVSEEGLRPKMSYLRGTMREGQRANKERVEHVEVRRHVGKGWGGLKSTRGREGEESVLARCGGTQL